MRTVIWLSSQSWAVWFPCNLLLTGFVFTFGLQKDYCDRFVTMTVVFKPCLPKTLSRRLRRLPTLYSSKEIVEHDVLNFFCLSQRVAPLVFCEQVSPVF